MKIVGENSVNFHTVGKKIRQIDAAQEAAYFSTLIDFTKKLQFRSLSNNHIIHSHNTTFEIFQIHHVVSLRLRMRL